MLRPSMKDLYNALLLFWSISLNSVRNLDYFNSKDIEIKYNIEPFVNLLLWLWILLFWSLLIYNTNNVGPYIVSKIWKRKWGERLNLYKYLQYTWKRNSHAHANIFLFKDVKLLRYIMTLFWIQTTVIYWALLTTWMNNNRPLIIIELAFLSRVASQISSSMLTIQCTGDVKRKANGTLDTCLMLIGCRFRDIFISNYGMVVWHYIIQLFEEIWSIVEILLAYTLNE